MPILPQALALVAACSGACPDPGALSTPGPCWPTASCPRGDLPPQAQLRLMLMPGPGTGRATRPPPWTCRQPFPRPHQGGHRRQCPFTGLKWEAATVLPEPSLSGRDTGWGPVPPPATGWASAPPPAERPWTRTLLPTGLPGLQGTPSPHPFLRPQPCPPLGPSAGAARRGRRGQCRCWVRVKVVTGQGQGQSHRLGPCPPRSPRTHCVDGGFLSSRSQQESHEPALPSEGLGTRA